VSDESGQILRHVITIGLVIVLVILILAEVGPLVVHRIAGVQDAETAAEAAATDYRLYRNEGQAVNEVAERLKTMGYSDREISEAVVQFLPASAAEKTTVKVTVIKYVNTLLTRRIKQLERFSRVAISQEASITGDEKQ
jgi:hypothetical protein